MRRQFLRVYIGIALVLLAAAGITAWLVNRQVCLVVDERLEATMAPWVQRIRQQLMRAEPETRQRDHALGLLNDALPFPVALVLRDSLSLPRQALRKLSRNRPALVSRDGLRWLYAPYDADEILELGPLRQWQRDLAVKPGPLSGVQALQQLLPRLRKRLLEMDSPAARQRELAHLCRRTGNPLRIIPRAQAGLSERACRRLDQGQVYLERVVGGHVAYVSWGADSLLAVGPTAHPGGPGWRRGRRGQSRPGLMASPGLPGHAPAMGHPPFQGTYVLVGALLAILAIIGGAVYWLLRPYERRILALADVAQQFGEGQFSSRAVPRGDDSISVLATRFNAMADRLAGLIERQQDLLRAVSHELRTPLARLFFLVDDAQTATDPEAKDAYLQRMETSLQELNELVDELLTFVRLEGRVEDQDRSPVPLSGLFDEVATLLRELHPHLEISSQGADLQVEAVPRMLRRAVRNLVANAARHARSRIRMSAEAGDGWISIHVDDDGPGVPHASREHVFEPFFRVDASRSTDAGGVGLGLAIVQRIALAHGGRVGVHDSPAGGARFTLELPLEN